jgi:nicotinamidase-related amidase
MKRALLVIDVQMEYFTGKLPVIYPDNSLQNILRAMDAAERNSVPIILVRHNSPQPDAATFRKGSEEWQLHPEIMKRKHARLIDKTLPGSFSKTDLEVWLTNHAIDTLAITGYMTQICCDTTAREAMHRGFSVEFLSDATGTLAIENYAGKVSAEELHRAILVTQAMRFSKVMTTDAWINGLAENMRGV